MLTTRAGLHAAFLGCLVVSGACSPGRQSVHAATPAAHAAPAGAEASATDAAKPASGSQSRTRDAASKTAGSFDGRARAAADGVVAAPADTWAPTRAIGKNLGVVDMKLVRGLDGVEAQPRTLPGTLTDVPAPGTDVSELPAGTWLHGLMSVTKTETVPFAVNADRTSLVLDSDRDGRLEPAERLERAQLWGGMAWFEGAALVRKVLDGKTLECLTPVRVGAFLTVPRMASRLDGRREGVIRHGGREIRMAIVDHTFRGWFSHPGIDSLLIDVDGDGAFDASPDSFERYRLGEAFPLGDTDAIVSSVGAFGSTLNLAHSPNPAQRKASLRIGTAAPVIEATTLEGERIVSRDLRGKWVLLDFWATWCGPCRRELPHLKELRRQHPDLVILGISGDDKAETVTNFVKAQTLDWPQVHAESKALMQAFRVRSFPTTFLIAPDGTIAARDLRGAMISSQIAKLKEGRSKPG